MSQLTYGKQCLLKAIVEALLEDSKSVVTAFDSSTYTSGAKKAVSLSNKTNLKDKLVKLFHFQSTGRSGSKDQSKDYEDLDDFEPMPCYSSKGKGKRSCKRKGAEISKGSTSKRKVKQVILSVVGLQKFCSRTPTGSARSQLMQDVWLNSKASEEVVREKIGKTFGWEDSKGIQFLFAQGKSLRMASLSDVENSSSCDLETVKVLMGTGALYVVKPQVDELESVASVYNGHCLLFFIQLFRAQPGAYQSSVSSIDIATLEEMFPNESNERVAEVYRVSGTLMEAIDSLSADTVTHDLVCISSDDELPSISLVTKVYSFFLFYYTIIYLRLEPPPPPLILQFKGVSQIYKLCFVNMPH